MGTGRKARGGGMGDRMKTAAGIALRRLSGVAAVAFLVGTATDVALSPLLRDILPLGTTRWTPTGLAWLYLVPVLLAHGLEVTLRPSLAPRGALALLTQPPADSARLAWTGPTALALLGLPIAALWVHWGFAFAWALVLVVSLRFALLPAAQVSAMSRPLRAAMDAGFRALTGIVGWGVVVLAVCFILSNVVLAAVMVPLSMRAGPAFQPGSGLLPLLQVNLLLALSIPALATVIAAAWQGHRQRAWRDLLKAHS